MESECANILAQVKVRNLFLCTYYRCKPTEYVPSTIPVFLVRYSFQKKANHLNFFLRFVSTSGSKCAEFAEQVP